MFGGNLEVKQGFNVEGTMKMLFGRALDCVAKDEYDGSMDESKTFMESVYGTCGDVKMNVNDKVGLGHSTETYSSLAELEGKAANEKHVKQSSSMPDSSVVRRDVPCGVVETFGHDIILSCYVTSVTVCLEHENRDLKEELVEVKSSDLEEIRKSLAKQRAEEFEDLESYDITKMLNTKKLPIHLRRHAVNLLNDMGWRITKRGREVRKRAVNDHFCISPEGPVVNSLTKAWVSCAEELHAKSLNPEYDEIGRQWSDIDEFYVEMADTLTYIEKEIQQLKSIQSHLLRWQLLDSFLAVVCIDRKIRLLKEGNALKAVNSKTSIIGGPETETTDEDEDEDDKTESNSCSMGSTGLGLVPLFMSDGKSKNYENCNHDVMHKHGFEQGNDKAYLDAYIRNQSIRSLKNMARCEGKEFCDSMTLRHMKRKTSAKKLEKKEPSNQENFMQTQQASRKRISI